MLVFSLCAHATASGQSFPGGFIENAQSNSIRRRWTGTEIQSMVPAERGKFKFPAPYNTEAVRITVPADCASRDCVFPVGYSYWSNTNNHVGGDTMLIVLGLDPKRGGTGPTLFSYNKAADTVKNLGPLFNPSSPFYSHSTEGWYFSANDPGMLYVYGYSPEFRRYDVFSKKLTTVYDAGARFGSDKVIFQPHSSADDRTHSATLECKNPGCTDGTRVATKGEEMMGCLVYSETTRKFSYFPRKGRFDECQLDRSGRWLLILEKVNELHPDGFDNVIVDLSTGAERTLLYNQQKIRATEYGAVGHVDMGYGYVVGGDSSNRRANAKVLYKFGQDPLQGLLEYYTPHSAAAAPSHISHRNARPDLPPEQQYACGSGADSARAARVNEILCFPLDGSQKVLVVAPVMTDMNIAMPGCDNYCKLPKGNLDVTGRYFIWTSNMGGSRLDAFVVKVPGQSLFAR